MYGVNAQNKCKKIQMLMTGANILLGRYSTWWSERVPLAMVISTLALMTVCSWCGSPDIFLNVGITYKLHVTIADTGFPGKQKKSFFLPFIDKVANVVGFLQKPIVFEISIENINTNITLEILRKECEIKTIAISNSTFLVAYPGFINTLPK